MKKFEFILQYPTPLEDEDLGDLIDIAKSGNFSRYASDYVLDLEKDLALYLGALPHLNYARPNAPTGNAENIYRSAILRKSIILQRVLK